jgi:radical SAM superfamily enzyme YgiQ (UPF0313 family)
MTATLLKNGDVDPRPMVFLQLHAVRKALVVSRELGYFMCEDTLFLEAEDVFNFRFGRHLASAEETYDFPPFRPPSEADSLLLRVTHGCPWNRCAFCPLYKGVPFKKRSVEEVKRDIETAGEFTGGNVQRVFIGDSDSLVIQVGEFLEILEHLHKVFPALERVTTYARARTLVRRSVASLREIRDAGLTRLHVGLETGSARLLRKIRKGAGRETMINACTRAKNAGFEVSLYVLLGMGGKTDWNEHALETAKVLNEIAPHFIRVRTLVPVPGTLVYRWQEEGSFKMAGPETILREQRLLVENLLTASEYLSDHVSNYAPVDGKLPGDKPQMLSLIDKALEQISTNDAFRAELESMQYLRRL